MSAFQAQTMQERKQLAALKTKFKAAKGSGALPIILKLDNYLHARKLRLRDLFTRCGFDKR